MTLQISQAAVGLLAMGAQDAESRPDVVLAATNLCKHINSTDPVERVTMLADIKVALEEVSRGFNNTAVEIGKLIDAEKNPKLIIPGKV